jgi:hypothetical protein
MGLEVKIVLIVATGALVVWGLLELKRSRRERSGSETGDEPPNDGAERVVVGADAGPGFLHVAYGSAAPTFEVPADRLGETLATRLVAGVIADEIDDLDAVDGEYIVADQQLGADLKLDEAQIQRIVRRLADAGLFGPGKGPEVIDLTGDPSVRDIAEALATDAVAAATARRDVPPAD